MGSVADFFLCREARVSLDRESLPSLPSTSIAEADEDELDDEDEDEDGDDGPPAVDVAPDM